MAAKQARRDESSRGQAGQSSGEQNQNLERNAQGRFESGRSGDQSRQQGREGREGQQQSEGRQQGARGQQGQRAEPIPGKTRRGTEEE